MENKENKEILNIIPYNKFKRPMTNHLKAVVGQQVYESLSNNDSKLIVWRRSIPYPYHWYIKNNENETIWDSIKNDGRVGNIIMFELISDSVLRIPDDRNPEETMPESSEYILKKDFCNIHFKK